MKLVMTEVLEKTIEDESMVMLSNQHGKNESAKRYSTFAEMYLEDNTYAMGATASVCTWRGVPTIDDW